MALLHRWGCGHPKGNLVSPHRRRIPGLPLQVRPLILFAVMEGKGKRKHLSEDPRVDAAMWALAEILAEISAKSGNPASSAAKHRPNDSPK